MEIKPESLRIGNLMKEHYTGKIISVIELTEKSITFSDSFIGKWQAEPIEVSEEILLKVGFEVIDDNPKQKPHYKGDVLFKIIDFEFSNSMKDGFVSYQINNGETAIKYIHQLQNLYFALTGTELNTSGL